MYGQLFSSSAVRREALAVAALASATPTRYATMAECRAAHEALAHGTLAQRVLARARLDADLRQIAADEPFWQASMDDHACAMAAEDAAEERAERQRAAASDTSRWF